MTARKRRRRLVNPRRLSEAWGGWQQATVHVVAWPARQGNGHALCGHWCERPELFPIGSAADPRVRAPQCRSCLRLAEAIRRAWNERLAEQALTAKHTNVVPLQPRRTTPTDEPARGASRARRTR